MRLGMRLEIRLGMRLGIKLWRVHVYMYVLC